MVLPFPKGTLWWMSVLGLIPDAALVASASMSGFCLWVNRRRVLIQKRERLEFLGILIASLIILIGRWLLYFYLQNLVSSI